MKLDDKAQRLLRFALFTALISWSLCAYVELGKYMVKGILFARVLDGRPYISDFANHYNAGLLASRCLKEKIDIYSIEVQNESLKKVVSPVVPEQPFYLQYPPYFFTLALPLSLLSKEAAWIAWNLLGLVLSLFGLFKLSKSLQAGNSDPKTETETETETETKTEANSNPSISKFKILALLTLASYPCWLSVELGQTSLYLLPALALTLSFLKQDRYFQSGLAAAFLMVKLQYAPIFVIFGLVYGKLRFLLGFLSCLSMLILLSLIILGPANLLNYPQALLSGETGATVSGVSSYMMQNLRGELVLLLKDDGQLTKLITIAVYALVVIFSGFLANRAQAGSCFFNRNAAIVIMLALLSSPHTHTQDYLILSAAALLLHSAKLKGRAAISMLTILPALSWAFFYLQPLCLMISVQPFFLYLLALVAFVLKEHSNAANEPS